MKVFRISVWLLVFATLSTLAACGSSSTPTPTPGISGTWNETAVNSAGVPRSRYVLVEIGGNLSGESYFRYEGALEHVGSLQGSVQDDGSAVWTTILNEDWEGTEVVTGTFSGNRFVGTFTIYELDGTIGQQGSIELAK